MFFRLDSFCENLKFYRLCPKAPHFLSQAQTTQHNTKIHGNKHTHTHTKSKSRTKTNQRTMSVNNDGSPSAPPAVVGPTPSLCPQLGPPPGAGAAAPQPTLLSSASTFAKAGVAPEMKARQVTPEDGAASPPDDEMAAPPPPGLSRTMTESMGAPPACPTGGSGPTGGPTSVPTPSGETAPSWPSRSVHNAEVADRDAKMSEADDTKMNFISSTSAETPKNHRDSKNHVIPTTEVDSTEPTTIKAQPLSTVLLHHAITKIPAMPMVLLLLTTAAASEAVPTAATAAATAERFVSIPTI